MNPAPAMWILAVAACAVLLSTGCGSTSMRGRADTWDDQMRCGAEASLAGRDREALACYQRALELAGRQPDPARIAYTAWHLGDVCFDDPGACPPDEARRRTEESLTIFAALNGPEHPVVIPILLRLSELQRRNGDDQGAAVLLERADRITARTFPESHFMRARTGDHRPAADLDPQEVLRILAEMDALGG